MSPKSRILTTAVTVAALLAAFAALPAAAQMDMPRVSQHAKVMQRVGVTDVTIDYHRPGVKGRVIWGELVPYDQVWRTGANERTTITFSTPVEIAGERVDAGTYGLLTIPGETTWTVILSNAAEAWGSGGYDEADDALRFSVTPQPAPHQEWMQFEFAELSSTSADVVLRWAELAVPFTVEVATDAVVTRGVVSTLAGAAGYCAEVGTCAAQAETWADSVIAVSPSFWTWRTKARLHAQQEEWSDAADAGESALQAIDAMDNPPPEGYVETMREWVADWQSKAE